MKAIGYIRVSTEDQTLGPEAQKAQLERWCASNGCELVALHVDTGVSGSAPIDERPALMAAVDSLRPLGATVLLVAKRDRLARDVAVAALIERLVERQKARVLTADGTGNSDGPEGVLMRGILDVLAQYERALIRARTKAALAVKKARRELVGSAPFGYGPELGVDGRPLPDAKLVPVESEQAALRRIRELAAAGVSHVRIATALGAEGFAPRGKRWHATTVARALRAKVLRVQDACQEGRATA